MQSHADGRAADALRLNRNVRKVAFSRGCAEPVGPRAEGEYLGETTGPFVLFEP
jgi:hypothetical protein